MKNTAMANIFAFSILSFIESLQALIIVVLIFSFIPFSVPPLVQKLFPLSQYDVHMERESFFYHIWIALALVLQGILMFLNRRRLGENHLWRASIFYVCTMAGLVIIQIFAVFKIFLWGNPWWSRDLFYVTLGLGVLARIFWPELSRLIPLLWAQSRSLKIPRWAYFLMDAGAILVLIILVFAPHLNEVLARMFSHSVYRSIKNTHSS